MPRSRPAWLAAVPAVVAALPLLMGARPTPRPVGPDGRVVDVRAVRIFAVGPVEWLALDRAGIPLERGPRGPLGEVTADLTAEEMDKVEALGLTWAEDASAPRAPSGAGPDTPPGYHTYDSLTSELQQVANGFPSITRLTSAGKSVQGRDLWFMKISKNPDVSEDEPAFKYISTMHGDEVVGMENCLKLIHWLTDRYATDTRVKRLVDSTEIWIMPLMNPDGAVLNQRYNASGVDLNRDFPDMYDDPVNTPAGRAVETGLLMNWQAAHATNLSANFHGGALVTNYPYDNTPDGGSYYSTSPDDDTFRDLSLDYSEDNIPMHRGDGGFTDGITNGADWYAISGGMQDWNYHWYGDMQLTIEVSINKGPSSSTLPAYWDDNRESMLSYMERVLSGVRGRVTAEDTGAPLAATMKIAGRSELFYTDPATGTYERPLLAGGYQIEASAPGYAKEVVPFSVAGARSDAVRQDVVLTPVGTDLAFEASRLVQDTGGDGFLDAGENGRLAVTLHNAGKGATGVGGTLRSIDPYLAAGTAATWPDIAGGASRESNEPHFTLAASPATPAGHRMAMLVDWSAASGGAGATAPFFLAVGAPATADVPATDVPKSIPNPGNVVSSVTVPDDRELVAVTVRVDITHPFIGDLRVSLVAPDARVFRLHDRSGGSADDIHTWYPTETPSVDDLGALAGSSSAGTWRLRVQDLAAGNAGTLTGWTLELVTRAWEDPVPEVALRSVTHVAGKTRLEWWPVGSATGYVVRRSTDATSAAGFADVTAEDPVATDTLFDDASPSAPGTVTYFIVNGSGHTGEGAWGHYGL